jgi:hypothetical protein
LEALWSKELESCGGEKLVRDELDMKEKEPYRLLLPFEELIFNLPLC